jgi:quinol monooxygenase YgiN
MSEEVSWLYEVDVKPGQAATLRALMAELIESTRAEPGTR